MPELDKAADLNRKAREDHPSQPCLDIDVTALTQCVRDRSVRLPHPYRGAINPSFVLYDNADKTVLCLASGGGQQSAFFGIVGAKVTVFDIADGQLEQDRMAAEHYSYPVKTVRGDMRDLSCFENETFDHVDMGIAIYAVPDVRPVYREIARVLKPCGTCRIEHMNPATMPIQPESWDGTGYTISTPYRGGPHPPNNPEAYNFRHLFTDIFNPLFDVGLAIKGVWESPDHLDPEVHGDPGSYEHIGCIVQCNFAVVAKKGTLGNNGLIS
jgi:SAM-dependent methyltransferase